MDTASMTPGRMVDSSVLRSKSQFEDSENFMTQSPRKRMRLPSLSGNSTNVTFQHHKVTRDERSAILGKHENYRGCTIWFTGLSGAGKTTISFALEKTLIQLGIPCYGLDGDNVRHGLCKNLGFKKEDRTENIRRVAEVSKLFADMGIVTLASFISPFRADREEVKRIHENDGLKFFEIYVNTSIDICEARDPKKLYKKARSGLLKGFTGIDSVYEEPLNPDLVLNAGTESEAQSVQNVLQFLYEKNILPEKAMYQLCGQPIRQLFVTDERIRSRIVFQASSSPRIDISEIDLQWLQVLAEGWASPIAGFMRERQYLQCIHHGQIFDLEKSFATVGVEKDCDSLSNISAETLNYEGDEEYPLLEPINQTIPITLSINDAQKEKLIMSSENNNNDNSGLKVLPCVSLYYNNSLIAVLKDAEIFPHRKRERIHRQFGFSDLRHPAIKMIDECGDWLIGGDLEVLDRITYSDGLDKYRRTPMELRKIFTDAGCDAVFAFQLRNPIHNGHALLMRETREQLLKKYKNPMLLLHPLGGWTKDDDVPLSVRIAQHEAVIASGVLDSKWTVLSIFPSPMLYAGPTEVQWHARARLACGINAYIVGRDPAGIQNPETGDFLYDPTHGAKVLSMAPGLPNLEILPFRVAAYDKVAKRMAFFDANRKADFIFISGTMMRNLAKTGQSPPDGFMVPEAWKILAAHYAQVISQSET